MTAINPLRGEARLEGGEGRSFKLCFDVNAFCYAEERLGKTTDEIVALVAEEFSAWGNAKLEGSPRINASLTRALLWAGLQKHHPGTHLAEAGEIMSDAGIATTAGAVLNGFFAAFGKAEDGEEKNPPTSAAPTEPGTG